MQKEHVVTQSPFVAPRLNQICGRHALRTKFDNQRQHSNQVLILYSHAQYPVDAVRR